MCRHLDSSCCSFELTGQSCRVRISLRCSRSDEHADPAVVAGWVDENFRSLVDLLVQAELTGKFDYEALAHIAEAKAVAERGPSAGKRLSPTSP